MPVTAHLIATLPLQLKEKPLSLVLSKFKSAGIRWVWALPGTWDTFLRLYLKDNAVQIVKKLLLPGAYPRPPPLHLDDRSHEFNLPSVCKPLGTQNPL